MKKFKLRQRGYDLLQITLGIAVALGLMAGGLIAFNMAQNSSELADKTRIAVTVSSEVRAQYRTAANFDALTAAATDGTDGLSYDSTFAVRSGIPEAQFANLALAGAGQDFTLTFTNLNDNICERMSAGDMGPNSVTDNANCGDGTLLVTYSR